MSDMIEQLLQAAWDVQGTFALSPDFSAGSVGAAVLSKQGHIYTGICIDLGCGIGFCAEHSAIAEMLKQRETEIEMVVAVSDNQTILPPCGRCREMMAQINPKNLSAKIVISPTETVLLSELLPKHWYV